MPFALPLLAAASALAGAPLAPLRVPGPLSPRAASYLIQARLDDVQHTITGRERLTFTNTVGGAPTTLVLHLYLEAFRNQESTFFRESHLAPHGRHGAPQGWGGVAIRRVAVVASAAGGAAGNADVTSASHLEGTLFSVPLGRPVARGEAISVEIEWVATLPPVIARTGWQGPFHMGAQWFPKAAVWTCSADGSACRWHADEYHADSEFFADWGSYDVTLDVPSADEVAATGVRVSDSHQGDRRILRYRADDVHDFAFAADPRFTVFEDRLRDAWGEVRILHYAAAGHAFAAPRHLAAARLTLEELERRFGVYPYSQLTVVDVPGGAEEAGGMEYPTLVTTVTLGLPDAVHLEDEVTAHEVGHQYLYGLVGSDEACEPWLDEGLNQTFTTLALERRFGAATSAYALLGRELSMLDTERVRYARAARVAPIASPSWGAFTDNSEYDGVIYAQAALTLRTVEGYLGPARYDAGWRAYVERWRFRHPSTDDFIAAFDEGAGEDLRWFWQPALRSTAVLDYEVMSVEWRHPSAKRGMYDCPTSGVLPTGCAESDRGQRAALEEALPAAVAIESEVVVRRLGELAFPVTLEVVFSDAARIRERWDGKARWQRYTYRRAAHVVSAEVDPDHRVALDLNTVNNGLRASPDARAARRLGSAWAYLLASLWQLP